jgi:uncharacterized protein DUF5658
MNTRAPIAAAAPSALIAPFKRRSSRVIVLVTLIAVMSMVDLYLTILYVTHTGMNEVNPLARAMMEYQSPAVLGIWKIATVVLGVGILTFIRNKRSAEFGAWIGFLILGMLMSHWVSYINEHSRISQDPMYTQALVGPDFVYMPSSMGRSGVVIP